MIQGMLVFEPKKLGKIHAARLENSPRLRASLRILILHSARGEKITTRSWQRYPGNITCNPHTDKAELLWNGIDVQHEQQGRLHYYWIKAADLPAARRRLVAAESGG